MVLLINESQVKKVLDMKLALRTVAGAFRSYGLGKVQLPAKMYLTFAQGDLRAMPAYINDSKMNIAGIKSVNVHPGNKKFNLPTVMAANIAMEWAARQDKKGLPGTKVMTSYLAELRRLDVKMLREWDKE